MESWRTVWRDGFARVLSRKAMIALRQALENGDTKLVQGATTTPPPMLCVKDWVVEAACGIGYCGWRGEGLSTVGEVEKYFSEACYECDKRLGEPGACRWFLNWFDDTPISEVRRELLKEVRRSLRWHDDEQKVVTVHVYPPIPFRGCDWVAHIDGDEEDGPYGIGATEFDAIEDLQDSLENK